VGIEGVPHLVGWIGPLDTAVKPFGVLSEDHRIDARFFGASVSAAADEIEGVSGKGDTRPNRHIEIEPLAKTDDG
jgi:hypothetical protein